MTKDEAAAFMRELVEAALPQSDDKQWVPMTVDGVCADRHRCRRWQRPHGDVRADRSGHSGAGVEEDEVKIKTNKVRCARCGTVIESKHRHDFVWCGCKAIAVDGGREYLRRVGNLEDIEELSEYSKGRVQ